MEAPIRVRNHPISHLLYNTKLTGMHESKITSRLFILKQIWTQVILKPIQLQKSGYKKFISSSMSRAVFCQPIKPNLFNLFQVTDAI